jgi:Arc/MetJ family transcription regulator
MTKRLIELDDDLLSSAAKALDSASMKETITEALKLAIRAKATRDHIETLASPVLIDLRDERIMNEAWRDKTV